jgi:hypothetical protein
VLRAPVRGEEIEKTAVGKPEHEEAFLADRDRLQSPKRFMQALFPVVDEVPGLRLELAGFELDTIEIAVSARHVGHADPAVKLLDALHEPSGAERLVVGVRGDDEQTETFGHR